MICRVLPKWWVFAFWFLATAISGVASWGMMCVVEYFTWGISDPAILTVTGTCVGVAQWFVLRSRMRSTTNFWPVAKWVVFSGIGGTIGWWGVVFVRTIFAVFDEKLIFDPMFPIIVFFAGRALFGLVLALAWEGIHPW